MLLKYAGMWGHGNPGPQLYVAADPQKICLQFPCDTGIDKVRKAIKKVGKKRLDDPEMGPDFIHPVKSDRLEPKAFPEIVRIVYRCGPVPSTDRMESNVRYRVRILHTSSPSAWPSREGGTMHKR